MFVLMSRLSMEENIALLIIIGIAVAFLPPYGGVLLLVLFGYDCFTFIKHPENSPRIVNFFTGGLRHQWHESKQNFVIAFGFILALLFLFKFSEPVLSILFTGVKLKHHIDIIQNALLLAIPVFLYALGCIPKKIKQLHNNSEKNKSRMEEIKSEGAEGERLNHEKLHELRKNVSFLDTNLTWMPSDDGIMDIVMVSNDGRDSKEIDDMLVLDKNIFIFEVKHWKGEVTYSDNKILVDGLPRKSPEIQTRSKIEKIRKAISESGGMANIIPVYVFTHKDVVLDPNLPHNYIKLESLQTFMAFSRRDIRYDKTCAKTNTNVVRNVISNLLDKGSDAKHKHMLWLAKNEDASDSLKEYVKLHQDINKNEQTAIALNNPRKILNNAIMVGIASVVVFAVALNFLHQ